MSVCSVMVDGPLSDETLKRLNETRVDVDSLATCVVLALMKSGGQENAENDVYWHTREASVQVARMRGFKITSLVRKVEEFRGKLVFSVITKQNPAILKGAVADVWPYVAHPSLILEEVMDG